MSTSTSDRNLRLAYEVIAHLQAQVESFERTRRSASRQLEMFFEDGARERITVALAVLEQDDSSSVHSCGFAHPPDRPCFAAGGSVRTAAAKAAVTALKKTGRPVDPRVASLADETENRCPMRHDGSGQCYRAYRHSGPCKFRRNGEIPVTEFSKPGDVRCEYCLPDGRCDSVPLNLGWCGTARLLAAIDAHPLGDSDNGPSRGGPHTSNGGDQ